MNLQDLLIDKITTTTKVTIEIMRLDRLFKEKNLDFDGRFKIKVMGRTKDTKISEIFLEQISTNNMNLTCSKR